MILNSFYPTTFSKQSDLILTDCVAENYGGASFTTESAVIVIMALILLTGISVFIGPNCKKKSPKITAPRPENIPRPEPDSWQKYRKKSKEFRTYNCIG